MYEIYIGVGPLIPNMYLEVPSALPYVRAGALGSENHKLDRTDWRSVVRFLASGGHGIMSQRQIRFSVGCLYTYWSTNFHATALKKFERPQKRYKHKVENSQNRGKIWNIN